MVKTVEKTLAIIDALQSLGPSGTQKLANELGIPRSTVHHHLQDLESHGYVKNESGTYRLALRFLEIGEQIRQDIELYEIAQSEIDELADRIDYPVCLFVEEQQCAVLLYQVGENPSIPTSPHPGQHIPLYTTAAGKALLSLHEQHSLSKKLSEISFKEFTGATITDIDLLSEELADVAERGYTTAEEERWNGRCSVAVPLQTSSDSYVASLEAAIPSDSFDGSMVQKVGSELEQTANVIRIKSDYSQ